MQPGRRIKKSSEHSGLSIIPLVLLTAGFLIAAGYVQADPVTIAWDPNDEPDLKGYKVYYGTASGTYDHIEDVGDVTIYQTPDLAPGYTYYFVVTAYDLALNESAYSDEISKYIDFPDTDPPDISGVHADDITDTGAVINWLTDEPADSQVEYGTTAAYGSETPVNFEMVTGHAMPLSSLSPATTYHYRVKSRDGAGNLTVSGDYTFQTDEAPDTVPPEITDIQVTDILDTQVTITWRTDEPATSQVQYGYTEAYGEVTPLDTDLVTFHVVNVSGLEPDSHYHFRVGSRDEAGNQSVSGDHEFDTAPAPDTTPPLIDNIEVTQITDTTAVISWTTNEPATTQIEYGTSPAYGLMTELDNTYVIYHQQVLTGLSPETVYHFRVLSSDEAGNAAASGNQQFTTEATPDTTPPDPPANVRVVE
jgi:hypothetical protein